MGIFASSVKYCSCEGSPSASPRRKTKTRVVAHPIDVIGDNVFGNKERKADKPNQ